MQNLPIGEVLKEYGYITQEQIDQALQFQKTQSGKKVRFGTLLQEMGFVTETQVLEALGKKLDLQMVNLEEYEVNVDVVAKVPKQLAEKYNVIALSENDSRLQLAMSDPLNFYAQEDIRQIVDMPLEVLLSESPKIKKAIEYYYAEISTKQAAKKANISAEDIEVPQLTADDADDDVPIIKLINSLLVRGYSTNASDIHIEPFKDFTQVRMRIDGQLSDTGKGTAQLHCCPYQDHEQPEHCGKTYPAGRQLPRCAGGNRHQYAYFRSADDTRREDRYALSGVGYQDRPRRSLRHERVFL